MLLFGESLAILNQFQIKWSLGATLIGLRFNYKSSAFIFNEFRRQLGLACEYKANKSGLKIRMEFSGCRTKLDKNLTKRAARWPIGLLKEIHCYFSLNSIPLYAIMLVLTETVANSQ